MDWDLFNRAQFLYNEKQPPTPPRKESEDCDHDFIAEDGFEVCLECGETEQIISDQHHEFDSSDRTTFVPVYNYSRLNRFEKIVSEFKGEEFKAIPDPIFDKIVKSKEIVDRKTLRKYLKKNKLTKYSPTINMILIYLKLWNPPEFELQPVLDLFKEFEVNWKYAGNFVNNHILLYKILNILGTPISIEELSCLKIVKLDADPRIDDVLKNL